MNVFTYVWMTKAFGVEKKRYCRIKHSLPGTSTGSIESVCAMSFVVDWVINANDENSQMNCQIISQKRIIFIPSFDWKKFLKWTIVLIIEYWLILWLPWTASCLGGSVDVTSFVVDSAIYSIINNGRIIFKIEG